MLFFVVLFRLGEEHDTVPVVGVVGLNRAAGGFYSEARSIYTVIVDEDVGYSLSAALRELLVVSGRAGVLISITANYDRGAGVGFKVFSYVVYVDHFLRRYVGRIDLEAYGGEQRSVDYSSSCFGHYHFGAGELSFGCGAGCLGSSQSVAEVVDLIVER